MTRIFRILMVALGVSLGAAATAAAQDYVVIVNDAVPATSLSVEELGRVFQKRSLRWPGGLTAEPVDQAENAAVRERFSQDVFRKSTAQMKAFWQTQIFSGRGVPPVEAASDQAVITYVQSHAGAVGYVSASTPLPSGVRRLRIGG